MSKSILLDLMVEAIILVKKNIDMRHFYAGRGDQRLYIWMSRQVHHGDKLCFGDVFL